MLKLFLLFSSLALALSGEEYRKMSIITVPVLSTDLSDSRAQESYAPFYFDWEGLRRALKMSFYSSFHFIVMAWIVLITYFVVSAKKATRNDVSELSAAPPSFESAKSIEIVQ